MSDAASDAFRQEVLGLFAEEAQEWLRASAQALDELRDAAGTDHKAKLIEQLTTAITNLGGSAATVELSTIEQSAFALLPLVRAMAAEPGRPRPAQCEAAHEALRFMADAIAAVAVPGAPADGQADAALLHALLGRLAEAADGKEPPADTLIGRLRQFQRGRTAADRRLIDKVLRRIESEGRGTDDLWPEDVNRMLQEIEHADERLARDVESGVPSLIARIEATALNGQDPSSRSLLTDEVSPAVSPLLEAAQEADSADVGKILAALQTVLRIWAQPDMKIDPTQVRRVCGRLSELSAMTQAWMEAGRVERRALEQVLAA